MNGEANSKPQDKMNAESTATEQLKAIAEENEE